MRAGVGLLALLAGCGDVAAGDGFAPLLEAPVDRDGRSGPATIAIDPRARALLLRATFPDPAPPAGACVQLVSAALDGAVWIAPDRGRPDWGPYCTTCAQRAFVGHGWGLYALPNDGSAMPPGGALALAIALRDCTTLLPVDPLVAPPVVRLEAWQPLEPAGATRATLSARIVFEAGGQFSSESAADPILLGAIAAARASFAQVDIELDVALGGDVPADGGGGVMLRSGDRSALDALAQRAAPDPGGAVPIVFTRCIESTDVLLHRTDRLDGLTPNIPGGYAPRGLADAVFVRAGPCDPLEPRAYWPSPELLGKTIAHELGHYLGLYHAVEADDGTDLLADTDATNLMSYRPLDAQVIGFSPTQGRILRAHPRVSLR